jgi:molybdopterin-guanine dinucleotide biosynthesis protein A
MGRDKALLPWRGTTMAQHIASVLAGVAGSVVFVGDPARYGALGYPVEADRVSGCGPIGGIVTALKICPAEWALVVACDMPGVTGDLLRRLLHEAVRAGSGCVMPLGATGAEPLCAAYHRDCLPVMEKAIAEGRFKMREVVRDLPNRQLAGVDAACLRNLNTPEDFEAFPRP